MSASVHPPGLQNALKPGRLFNLLCCCSTTKAGNHWLQNVRPGDGERNSWTPSFSPPLLSLCQNSGTQSPTLIKVAEHRKKLHYPWALKKRTVRVGRKFPPTGGDRLINTKIIFNNKQQLCLITVHNLKMMIANQFFDSQWCKHWLFLPQVKIKSIFFN